MLDFIKPPNDLLKRSKSTQFQWFFIIGFFLIAGIYMSIAGPVYLLNWYFGFETTPKDVWHLTIIAAVIYAFKIWYQIYQMKKSLKQLNSLAGEVKKRAEEVRKSAEQEPMTEDGKIQRILDLTIDGKTKPIMVRFEMIPGESPSDTLHNILDEAFDGLVLEARAKPQESQESEAQENPAG